MQACGEKSKSSRYRGDPKSKGNSPIKLYVDGLNYLRRFLTINKSKHAKAIDIENDLKKASCKVKHFVKAAKNSNISIEVFIDKSVATKETFLKWKSRREKEYNVGKACLAPCPNDLLGELFMSNGIKVHFSTVDCDDTIASFAYHYGGSVLSNDSDFSRYTTENSSASEKQSYFQIFSGFQLKNGKLDLIPAQLRPNKKIASQRIFLSPPPETRTSGNFLDPPGKWEIDEDPEVYGSLPSTYTRGNASCLLRNFPNPHLTVRPLRQALYNRLGEKRVKERICTWNFDERKVEWVKDEVLPNGTLDYLLDDLQAAVRLLFGHEIKPKNVSDLKWKNHLFAQKVVVAFICGWATGKSILEELNSVSFYCAVCNVQCSSTVHYQSHAGGKRHAENVAAQMSQNYSVCAVKSKSAAMNQSRAGEKQDAKKAQLPSNTIACNIYVNSGEMLKSHKLGKKHKKMLETNASLYREN